MATKSPSISPAPGTKKKSVQPGQTPTGATPPLGPKAKSSSLNSGEGNPVVYPNAPPPPLKPTPPTIFKPWLRTFGPPWEKIPKPPLPQPKWKAFNPKMLWKYRLPPQVEFQDANWTHTMLDITMKKRYPKVVKMYVGPVKVTHEKHEGPVQVYLQPLAKEMPGYLELPDISVLPQQTRLAMSPIY